MDCAISKQVEEKSCSFAAAEGRFDFVPESEAARSLLAPSLHPTSAEMLISQPRDQELLGKECVAHALRSNNHSLSARPAPLRIKG